MRLSYRLILFIGVVLTANCAFAQYEKLLVIGNSLTQHPFWPSLDWYNTCGMAASSLENDFAHQLQSRIQADQTGDPLLLVTAHIADEINTMTGTGQGSWTSTGEALTDTDADVIVFELGDNYRGALDWANYGQNYVDTINEILAGAAGSPKILLTSNWYANSTRDALNAQVAATVGATFVVLTDIASDPANWGISEPYAYATWATNGVGSHPGDTGMAAIAERIYENVPEPATMSLLCVGGWLTLRRRRTSRS